MKWNFCLFFFLIALFLVGCDPYDGKLVFQNNSSDTVYYCLSFINDSLPKKDFNNIRGDSLYKNHYNIIPPKSQFHEAVMDTWEYFINERCIDSTLTIFFFTQELINNKDSAFYGQHFSKKLTLKVSDLKKMNWKVVYP